MNTYKHICVLKTVQSMLLCIMVILGCGGNNNTNAQVQPPLIEDQALHRDNEDHSSGDHNVEHALQAVLLKLIAANEALKQDHKRDNVVALRVALKGAIQQLQQAKRAIEELNSPEIQTKERQKKISELLDTAKKIQTKTQESSPDINGLTNEISEVSKKAVAFLTTTWIQDLKEAITSSKRYIRRLKADEESREYARSLEIALAELRGTLRNETAARLSKSQQKAIIRDLRPDVFEFSVKDWQKLSQADKSSRLEELTKMLTKEE